MLGGRHNQLDHPDDRYLKKRRPTSLFVSEVLAQLRQLLYKAVLAPLSLRCGRMAQLVERGSNKPTVQGSSPCMTTLFCFVLL